MKYQLLAFSMIQYVYHSMYKRSFYFINRRDLYQQTTLSYHQQKANVTDMFRYINRYTRDQKKHSKVQPLDELVIKDIVEYNDGVKVMYELKDIYDTTLHPDEKILFNDLFKNLATVEILDKNQWSLSYYKKTLRGMKRKISKNVPLRPVPDLRCVLSEP